MAGLAGDGTCIECEALTHWVELHIIDEHNKGFAGIKGLLTDGAGTEHKITLKDGPILVKKLAAGPVTLVLDNETWLAEAQTRKPDDGTDPEIAKSLDGNLTKPGNKASIKALQSVTTGDLIILEGEQKLPKKHLASGALKLISDNSYVIKVAGFNYLTLRLGIFFDGTTNNTFSAQWGKKQLEGYYHKWKSHFDTSTKGNANYPINQLSDKCFEYPNEDKFHYPWSEDDLVDGSAANEVTNVEKLEEMYLEKEFLNGTYIDKLYINGIGTDNEEDNTKPADESVLLGQGLGTGDYGLEAKVAFTIQKIADNLSEIIETAKSISDLEIDGLIKIELDVFGFSRGAAAGRDFINYVLDGPEGEFATKITQACTAGEIDLSVGFDWLQNKHCEVTFAGLYDSVAAIVDLAGLDFTAHNTRNANVRLWLDPKRVSRVVHLTAHPSTEYRSNFCLNLLNDPDTAHFHEHSLPGAHSDLGGGYFAGQSFSKGDYLLPRLEKKLVAKITKSTSLNRKRDEIQLNAELDEICKKEMALGWPNSFYREIKMLKRGGKNKDKDVLVGKVWLKRKVEGDLSRLYLRLMFGLAKYYQVPIDDTDGERWSETGYIVPENLNGIAFADTCNKVLKSALKGQVLSNLKSESFKGKLFDAQLIHHSSAEGIAFSPHYDESEGRYYRKTFKCEKEN